MKTHLLPLLCALGLAACGGSGSGDNTAVRANTSTQTTRFVAFGDAGKVSDRQLAVGEAMAEVCRARGCDFALELGDNFYDAGVQSVNDEQFQTKFEIPYKNLKGPVYVTLGNHDNSFAYGEGADNERGNYQVDYHYLAGRTSDKWRMPARYYHFASSASVRGAPLADFYSLDSNPLTAIVSDPRPQWDAVMYGSEQLMWLEGELKNSNARWKVAFAHHPYLSNGIHGNAGNYDGVPPEVPTTTNGKPWKDFLEASVCKYGVDLFIAGHDHDLEWLKPVPSCGKTHFIVSGAAETPRPFRPGLPVGNETFWSLDDTLGFFWIELKDNSMTISAFTLGDDLKLPRGSDGKPTPAFEATADKPY
jgi:tartrate-resistant acid phosphatase type 5